MSKVGFQDFWVVGARFYFQLEAQAGVEQPLADLGTIDSAVPTSEAAKAQLFDADGGVKRLVDEAITSFTESWAIALRNCSLDNLAIVFQANAPESFTQSAGSSTVDQWVTPGRLAKLKDSASAFLYGLSAIAGVYTGAIESSVLTAMSVSAKTLTVTGDKTAEAGYAAGKVLIVPVTGLANVKNARSYTVVSTSFGSGSTTVVVAEAPAANETAITGVVINEDGGSIKKQGIDWEPVSADRGIFRAIDGGGIAAAASYKVVVGTKAISGARLLHPQAFQGVRKGAGFIFLGRSGNADQTVREATVSLAPNGSPNFPTDDFATLPITATVLSDVTATVPAGRLLQAIGSLPSTS